MFRTNSAERVAMLVVVKVVQCVLDVHHCIFF